MIGLGAGEAAIVQGRGTFRIETDGLIEVGDRKLKTARAGNAAFVSSMLPKRRAADLIAWIFDGRLDALYRAPAADLQPPDTALDLFERIRIYEALQQLHLERERPRVLFDQSVPEVCRTDAADLRRLDVAIGSRAGPPSGQWDAIVATGPQGLECRVS